MAIKIFHSLKFQITAVLLILLALFSFSISYTLYAIDEREKEMAALHLVNRLQIITNYMNMQSLNYLKNAPKNHSDYKRDIGLYYDDLRTQLDNKDEIIQCFSNEHLKADLVNMDRDVNLNLDKTTKQSLRQLQKNWDAYYQELSDILGHRNESPKLAAAAKYIFEHQKNIKDFENSVVTQLQSELKARIDWINSVNKSILLIAALVSLITLIGFYFKVIIPLNRAVEGFNKVAKGDFGHQVMISGDSEIASMTQSFNHLSLRLSSIFKLIHRIQQGDDLDTTLGFIAEQFSSILPINWTSVLLQNGRTTLLELQKVFVDGNTHALPRTIFSIEGTLLEKAMGSEKPLLISNLKQVADDNPHFVFLSLLSKEGMNSAIFLHLDQSKNMQVPGMLIFASRQIDAYNDEHIELLNNIAHLATYSFAKTIKMAEQRRLAAIGEFTSGIVHEVRNPLTTISLAIKYFSRLNLDEDGQEWAEISERESARMARLLEDVLLYSKPIQLNLSKINLSDFIHGFIRVNKDIGADKSLQLNYDGQENIMMQADTDRLSQIFLNIYRNAVEAADQKTSINCTTLLDCKTHTVSIMINNMGSVIDKEIIERIGEPFFTTKSRGTGLGMGIVKRMLAAHNGCLEIHSTREQGTTIMIVLPYFQTQSVSPELKNH